MTDHPINPPPELLHQWATEYWGNPGKSIGEYEGAYDSEKYIAIQAARWGADQQLNEDCEWLTDQCLHLDGSYLRAAMRFKPPSLKEQALEELDELLAAVKQLGIFNPPKNIRRALEALDD